jgi:hypothetical protein
MDTNGTFNQKPANRCLETFEISPERLWLYLESRSCLIPALICVACVACSNVAIIVVIVVLMNLNIVTSDKGHLRTVFVFVQQKQLISYLHFRGLVAGVLRWFERRSLCVVLLDFFASVVVSCATCHLSIIRCVC